MRDGLQIDVAGIGVADNIRLIDALSEAGLYETVDCWASQYQYITRTQMTGKTMTPGGIRSSGMGGARQVPPVLSSNGD